MNEKIDPVMILGMYRSGISAITGCMHLLDVNLGQNLMSENESEQFPSFFGNSDIILIHDILLRDLGCRWDMIGSLPENWLQSKAADAAREKISNLIERDFPIDKLWAVSDPRLCKLLPLWMEIFEQKGVLPKIVFLIRHPYEVACSLKKSYGFDLLKGHLLWFACNRQALFLLRNYNHVILTYDRLLADPVSCLETISRKLNLNFTRSLRDAYQDVIAFIRPELKHEHYSQASLRLKEKEVFAHFAGLYDQLRIHQARGLEGTAMENNSTESNFSSITDVLNPADFPLFPKHVDAYQTPVNTSHASGMFNNLLSLISIYEQAEIDREIKRQRLFLEAEHHEPMLYAQIFIPETENEILYMEENSKKILLAPEEWQKISVDINNPEALWQNRLRFDPLNAKGLIRIQSMSLINSATDQLIWTVPGSVNFDECLLEGRTLLLDHGDGLLICATDNDPHIFLPVLPNIPDVPLRFEAWLKVNRNLNELDDLWKEKEKTIQNLEKEKLADQSRFDELKIKHEHSEAEWEKTSLEFEKTIENLEKEKLADQSRFNELKAKHEQSVIEGEKTRLHLQETIKDLENKEKNFQKLQNQFAQKETEAESLRQKLQQHQEKLYSNENDLEKLQQDLQQFRDKLVSQEKLTREYFAALSKSESQLVEIREKANKLEDQKIDSDQCIRQLQKDYQALIRSVRWKVGNRLMRIVEILIFRKKQPLAVDHMQQVFNQFNAEDTREKLFISTNKKFFQNPYTIKQINTWMRQLNKDFEALKNSKRWKIGNAIIRGVEIISFKSRQAMATDHLEKIFKDYEKHSNENIVEDIEKLKSWLRQAKKDFMAIQHSRRWKVGNSIFSTLDTLLFRGNKATAMDHAQKIFLEYDKLELEKTKW